MALPQFNDYRPNGQALANFGLSADDNFDPVTLLIYGLAFPGAAIWNFCEVIENTPWSACATQVTGWTLSPVITNTNWIPG